jgi:hypothetical protein
MGHVQSDVASFRIDDSTGAIAVISGSVNSVSMDGGQELLEDTGLGDSRRTVVAGLGSASNASVNGMLVSTTEAIFGPLTDGTSITKTVGIGFVTGQYLNGEVWPESVTLAMNAGEISTWSVNLRAQDGLTRTSVVAT